MPIRYRDLVVAQATDHHVIAGTGLDLVVADIHAGDGKRRAAQAIEIATLYPISQSRSRLERGGAFVCQDDIVSAVNRDVVASQATNDEIISIAGLDGVAATLDKGFCPAPQVGRSYRGEDPCAFLERHDAVVAKDRIVATHDPNRVAAQPAGHNVVVGTGVDDVNAPGNHEVRRRERIDVEVPCPLEIERVQNALDAERHGAGVLGSTADLTQTEIDLDPCGIANDRVVALSGIDGVAERSADDGVVVLAAGDVILAASERVDGEDHKRRQLATIREVVGSAVAEHRRDPAVLIVINDATQITEDHVAALATGNVVSAGSAEDNQRQRRVVGVDVVIAALTVEDEEVVGAISKVNSDGVAAVARVQCCLCAPLLALPQMRGGDIHDVAVLASPQGDSVEEISVRSSAETNGATDTIEVENFDLDVAQNDRLREVRVNSLNRHGSKDRALAQRGRLIADHHDVAALAGIDVQVAEDPVKMAGQEVERVRGALRPDGVGVEVRIGGNEDPIITIVQSDVRDSCGRTLDIENVGAGTEVDVQFINEVIIDAIHPGDKRGRSAQGTRIHSEESDTVAAHDLPQNTLEEDLVCRAEAAYSNVVGEAVAHKPLEGVANLVRRRVVGKSAGKLATELEPERAAGCVDRQHLHVVPGRTVSTWREVRWVEFVDARLADRDEDMSVSSAGGKNRKQAVRQSALEADDEHVVDLVNGNIARANRLQPFKGGLHVRRTRRHVQQTRGKAVKAQRERTEGVARQGVVDKNSLDGVRDRHAHTRQGRTCQDGPRIDGIRRTEDVESIRASLEKVPAARAEQVHRGLGEDAVLGEPNNDPVTKALDLEVGRLEDIEIQERLLDRRRRSIICDRCCLLTSRRLGIRVCHRALEPERERAASGIDDNFLLVRRSLCDESAARTEHVRLASHGRPYGRGRHIAADRDERRDPA